MRRFSTLAIAFAIAAIGVACGNSAGDVTPEINSFVTEQPLGTTTIDGITTQAFLVVAVGVDANDPGCEIDGIPFISCVTREVPTTRYPGPTRLCELDVGGPAQYFVACAGSAMNPASIDELQELPHHCPDSH